MTGRDSSRAATADRGAGTRTKAVRLLRRKAPRTDAQQPDRPFPQASATQISSSAKQDLRQGVSLLEVLIALGLTALVTGLVFGGGPALSKRFVEGRHQQVARALAWQKLAELEAATIRPGRQNGAFGGEFPGFAYDLLVEPGKLAQTTIEGLFRVTLRISRVEAGARSADKVEEDVVSLETLVFNRFP